MGGGRKTWRKGRTIRDRQEAGCGELFLESRSPKWLPGEHLVEQSNETRLKPDQEVGFPLQAKPEFSESSSDPVPGPKALGKGFHVLPTCKSAGYALPTGPWLDSGYFFR